MPSTVSIAANFADGKLSLRFLGSSKRSYNGCVLSHCKQCLFLFLFFPVPVKANLSFWYCYRLILYSKFHTQVAEDAELREQNIIPPARLKMITLRFCLGVLPISLLLLFLNALPIFHDHWEGLDFLVYIVFVSFFGWFLAVTLAVFTLLSFLHQIRLLLTTRSEGSLSLTSMPLQSVVFMLLAVLQFMRNIDWWKWSFDGVSGKDVYLIMNLSLYVGYFFSGVGFGVLFVIGWWVRRGGGAVRLDWSKDGRYNSEWGHTVTEWRGDIASFSLRKARQNWGERLKLIKRAEGQNSKCFSGIKILL